MINNILVQGIEIRQASKPFSLQSGMTCAAGSFVVSMAQPKMGLIRYLLGRTFFPDSDWTHDKDGSSIHPYDMSTDTIYEYMGVRVDPVDEAIRTDLKILTGPLQLAGTVSTGGAGYFTSGSRNESFHAVNRLLAGGVTMRRVDKPAAGLQRATSSSLRRPNRR